MLQNIRPAVFVLCKNFVTGMEVTCGQLVEQVWFSKPFMTVFGRVSYLGM